MECARLTRYGLLSVKGDDAREFLHAQLTNDIANLPPGRAVLAGWCSAKGRLLASLVVIPADDGFLLQLARDLADGVTKRLSMFILRSKVKITNESEAWAQFGLWGADVAGEPFAVSRNGKITVNVADKRALLLLPVSSALPATTASEADWTLQEIRAGRALITGATQDLFVPQMVNFDQLGAVDFRKGCFPGQEIVARARYRGQVKRRLVRMPAPAGAELRPGQELNGGVVVDSALGEVLAVMPV
jgi:folate-binding protein YgfZ